ncbi:hypothetical protein MPL3356_110385 [Mesorhizobium plurifarium]|uniref:Uncharacterized protein n=1 Tax=Mesorhizobium plurifarium TaxID=69974 RepID=A0A090DAL2_MESPL|nr:hypothetical protein MPL3356_110385 [Mesorhizobium plurifarium]
MQADQLHLFIDLTNPIAICQYILAQKREWLQRTAFTALEAGEILCD